MASFDVAEVEKSLRSICLSMKSHTSVASAFSLNGKVNVALAVLFPGIRPSPGAAWKMICPIVPGLANSKLVPDKAAYRRAFEWLWSELEPELTSSTTALSSYISRMASEPLMTFLLRTYLLLQSLQLMSIQITRMLLTLRQCTRALFWPRYELKVSC